MSNPGPGAANISYRALQKRDPLAAEQALRKELEQLIRLGTFRPTDPATVPSKYLQQSIPSLIVAALKQLEGGGDLVAKARLVGRGDLQKKTPFAKTSSPTAPTWAFYLLLAFAAQRGLKLRCMDVVCAYPNAAHVGEPVYMWVTRQISRIIVELRPDWARFVQHDGRMLLHLEKALYGLRDAGLMWHNTLTETLVKKLHMQPVSVEPNVFLHGNDYLLKYVDDLALFYRDQAVADKTLRDLRAIFTEGVKSKDGDTTFLGLHVEQLPRDPSVFLISQPKQTARLLADYGHVPKPRWKTPTPARLNLLDPDDSLSVDPKPYLEILGKVSYLKATRPDIAATLSILQTFCSRPTKLRMADAHRLVWYLLSTDKYGLVIAPSESVTVDAAADASFLIHEDARSHGGFIITFAGTPIAWGSSKIDMITKSSTLAELYQAERSLTAIDETRDLTEELCKTKLPPSRLLQDNMSTMQLAINGFGKATKSKPWQIRTENLKAHLEDGSITLRYQHTAKMAADGLTKILPPGEFEVFRARLNVFDLRQVRLRGRAALASHGGVLGM